MLWFLWACSSVVEEEKLSEEEAIFADCPTAVAEQKLIDVGEVTLNVSCRGSGDTVLFLHGFPEFSYSWDKVMDELAGEYRLIAPDQRGYNLSDKPEELSAYEVNHLVNDIANLIPLIADEKIILVAHDWGGPVGWWVAHHHPDLLRGFVGTNAPHPTIFADLLTSDPEQQAASEYMNFFRQEGAEEFLSANDHAGLIASFNGALSGEDIPIYQEAWSQPGALTGGLNWYRANEIDETWLIDPVTVTVPTVVMWGMEDSALLPQNIEGLENYVSDLRLETFPSVDHWINHRIPADIAEVIRELDAR